jgi:hypothetical protein
MTIVASSSERPGFGSHRFLFRLARRRRRQRWLISGTAVAVISAICVAAVVSVLALSGIGQSLEQVSSNVNRAIVQSGAATAASADGVARDQRIPDGALTVAALNRERPSLRWLPGDIALPANTALPASYQTSVDLGGDHVVTATRLAATLRLPFCIYGLAVSANNDPVISQDHLPGVGNYWATLGSPTSMRPTCLADSAPNSGWRRADPTIVRIFVKAHSGPSRQIADFSKSALIAG